MPRDRSVMAKMMDELRTRARMEFSLINFYFQAQTVEEPRSCKSSFYLLHFQG